MTVRGVNKMILIGCLGQDPEVRYTPCGEPVANLKVATKESWRDKKTRELCEKTEWHRVVLFGKQAEIAGEYLRKGVQIYVEGQLRTRQWRDSDDVAQYATEIVVGQSGSMHVLGGQCNCGWQQQDNPQVISQAQPASQSTDSVPTTKKGRRKGQQDALQPEQQPLQEEYPPIDMDDDIPQ